MSKLSSKQQLFVERYLIHRNATQAYREAGYNSKGKAAEANAARLISNDKVQAAIREGEKGISERNQLTQDWVIQRLMAVADGHIGKVATFNGKDFCMRHSEDLDEDSLRCLASISKKDRDTRDGVDTEFKIGLRDNVKALELCGKHIGMWKGDDGSGPEKQDSDSIKGRLAEFLGRVGQGRNGK